MEIQNKRGAACPLGVTKQGENQIQIVVWRKNASGCRLCLYQNGKIWKKYKMYSMSEEGMPDVFSILLLGDNIVTAFDGMEYDFMSDGVCFPDIYARAVSGREKFGVKKGKIRGRFDFTAFDWSGEKWTKLPKDEMILYQCHVRGFTKHTSSLVENPGTFLGMKEKISYLKGLGVNTLLVLPVYDFNERMKQTDKNGERRINYWGYAKEAFYFAPKASYAAQIKSPSLELKKLIKELHQNQLNIILDMYFENQTPEFIIRCLRYYALHFHVDGFRINQNCMDTGWLRNDPVLSHVKLIGTGWEDQPEDVGNESLFEMNDGFMIDARRYLKSDEGQAEKFYYRFREQRNGVGVIHYMTQNNGFTLRDLVSYDVKHNEANGEKNQDGTEYNYSWNCGVEGTTRRKTVLNIRRQQERNALVMLFLGMGTPMLLAGDEFGNSQKGNNNAYCQDNLTTWLDWRLLEKNKSTYEFVSQLIAFRKEHTLYHQRTNLKGMDTKGVGAPDISSHGREPWVSDFSYYSRELGVLFYGSYFESKSLYFAFNFHWDAHEFYLPDVDKKNEWIKILDTADAEANQVIQEKYKMAPRSIVVFEKVCSRSERSDRKKN